MSIDLPYYDAARMRREACHYLGQLRDLVENEQYQPSRNNFEASLFHTADAYKAVGLISLDEHAKILNGERL